jgi:hypothetical protein
MHPKRKPKTVRIELKQKGGHGRGGAERRKRTKTNLDDLPRQQTQHQTTHARPEFDPASEVRVDGRIVASCGSVFGFEVGVKRAVNSIASSKVERFPDESGPLQEL